MTRFQCLVLAEFLLIIAVGVLTWSILMPNWLLASGSQFMYPPGLSQGFPERQYGLVYVEGLRKQSWAELASSACDSWGMYLNTKQLYPIASNCKNNAKPELCTEKFETHFRNRCEIYSDMTLLSFVVVGVLSVAVTLVGVSSICMLVISVAKWKRMMLAGLMSGFTLTLLAIISYAVFSLMWFKQLTTTATYPKPNLSAGYFLCIGGMVVLGGASFVFYRLSAGLKFNPKNSLAVGTGGLLDLAEAKYVDQKILIDDEDELIDDEDKLIDDEDRQPIS